MNNVEDIDYTKALAKVRADKPVDGFYSVQLDMELVIPAKDFKLFLEAIQHAKKKSKYYSDSPRLTALQTSDITITPFSREEYEGYQVASLLNLDRQAMNLFMESQANNKKHL